jgi:hypothetical protein
MVTPDVRAEVKPVVEAAAGVELPTAAYNRTIIYFYNREFSLVVSRAATESPALLTQEACAWWRRYAADPANAQVIGAKARSLAGGGRRGGRGRGAARPASRPASEASGTGHGG